MSCKRIAVVVLVEMVLAVGGDDHTCECGKDDADKDLRGGGGRGGDF